MRGAEETRKGLRSTFSPAIARISATIECHLYYRGPCFLCEWDRTLKCVLHLDSCWISNRLGYPFMNHCLGFSADLSPVRILSVLTGRRYSNPRCSRLTGISTCHALNPLSRPAHLGGPHGTLSHAFLSPYHDIVYTIRQQTASRHFLGM